MTGSPYADRPVLVTGAGGFIASHLVESLVRSGARVRAFVRYNSRGDPGLLKYIDPETYAQLEIISGDLTDLQALKGAAQGIHTIFHLGALIAIPYSYIHPAEVVSSNITGTLNVLLAAQENKVSRMVHTSTSEVYGTAQYVPINEDHPLQGQSPYSASKIGADKLVESFFRSFNLPVVTLRPFNTYGPRQSARAVIPTIITQALTQRVISLGNLSATRDLTYIEDTVRGFVLAGTASNIEGSAINLGTGSEVSISDLASLIMEIIGVQAEIHMDQNRLRPERSEVQRLVSDNRLARQLLGWEPEYSLSDGLKKTIRWIENNLAHYKPGKYHV